jgi:predicted transcriptional regulator
MEKRTFTLSVRVSEEMRGKLAAIAKAERRTVSQVMFIMLEDELERRGKTAAAKS